MLLILCSSELTAQHKVDPALSLSATLNACIRSLDSANYLEREEGVEKLSSLGMVAIRPLAIQIVSGTPESVWRSRQALETIGIRGDEETFLKTVCVLKLLFVGASESLTQKISELEVEWKLEQKRNIIDHLQSKGARVSEEPGLRGLGLDNDAFVWNEIQVRSASEPDGDEQRARLPAIKISTERPTFEALRDVDTILGATVEENRNRLFGKVKADEAAPDRVSGIDPEILMELQLQRRFGVPMRGQIVGRNREFPIAGITLRLDEQWRGTAEDLKRIKGLDDLKRVEIHQVDLPAEQFATLSESSSIVSLSITGDKFLTEQFQQLKNLPKIQDFEISDRVINSGELESLGRLPNLKGLTLNRVRWEPETIAELAGCKQLLSMAIFEMKLGPSELESLGKLASLRMLSLELCKFQTESFRALKRERPELEIAFTPQALLGVRGPLNLDDSRCEISQVVPNSGADLGGLQPGDVVQKINGQAVEVFEDLRLHVAQHQAGEVLSLVVDRGGKEIELKVQLTPFEPVD